MKAEVLKGALLHDIGKLIMRATGEKLNHSSVGVDYLKEKGFSDEVIECVKFHHAKDLSENKNNLNDNSSAYIVYEADNISSQIDRRDNLSDNYDGQEWKSDIPLKTIFSSFKSSLDKESYYYLLRDLNPDNPINYPVKEILATSDKYSMLKSVLDKELNSDLNINSLLELLESTSSYVPSSVSMKQNADISLYDHSKTTAMIASCLFDYCMENGISDLKKEFFTNPNREKNYYLLVSGDISGIQDFIYTISSKGALKSLRARSFYLDMILEHIVDEILDVCGGSRANLMYNGGGHFYILLPNTEFVKSKLMQAEKTINDWFISEFGIDLYLALSYVEASSANLMNTKSIFKQISLKLSKNKQARYTKEQLKTVLAPHKNKANSECSICKTSLKTSDIKEHDDLGEVCDTCYSLFLAGKYLVNDNIVISITDSENEHSLLLPSLDDRKKFLHFGMIENAVRYYVKNERYTGKNYATNLFVGDYNYRVEKDELADFQDLVQGASGMERLAAFRCDVDNLGLAFTNGFSDEYSTISRVTSLSRQLSLFFKFYINKICKGQVSGSSEPIVENFYINNEVSSAEKRMLIVYSGGDDVFVVGAWIDVLNFAIDLRKAFKRFTCGKLTLSGGIGLFSTAYPISQIASQSGMLESFAKAYDNDTKDSVALFGVDEKSGLCLHTYHWDEFIEVVVSKVKLLYEICRFDEDTDFNKGKIFFSTSMMYKFKQLLENSEKSVNMARFAYTLARIVPNDSSKEKHNESSTNAKRFKDCMYKWATTEKKSLLTALEIIIYLNRKEVQHG